jgi:hypothetical protein
MLNAYSLEETARTMRQDREAEAAHWALLKQLPPQRDVTTRTHQGLVSALVAAVSSLVIFHRGS